MASILFLCHRLPWPPDKGDKIRSYHVLRRLVESHDVYLGAFVDNPDDWRHLAAVREMCADVCIRPLNPWQARMRALHSLTQGRALTLGCYRDRPMQHWVDQVLAVRKPEVALCYSSAVAPLVMHHGGLRRIMDFVDADSDKWRQFAQSRHGLARTIYTREARLLAAFERDVAIRFDASLFVSSAEADFFHRVAPEAAGKIHGIANGVDTAYWNPRRDHDSPYPKDTRVVVFVGAMDYHANAHAAAWFAQKVWPRVRAARPDARFYIVGTRPTRKVRILGRLPGITVTGQVDDVRPYLAHAHAVAAPLRIARGIQNKILEALAMEKAVLATREAWEGITDFKGRRGCITDSPEVMAMEALHCLDAITPPWVPAARSMVLARYSWTRNLDAYVDALGCAEPGPRATQAVCAPGRETHA